MHDNISTHPGRKRIAKFLAAWKHPQLPLEAHHLPYHEYGHRLVHAGWDNLEELDNYMGRVVTSPDLVISVLDINNDLHLKRWPGIRTETDLNKF